MILSLGDDHLWLTDMGIHGYDEVKPEGNHRDQRVNAEVCRHRSVSG